MASAKSSPLARSWTVGFSKYRGVYWDGSHNRFRAEIGCRKSGTRKRLGRFDDEKDAAEAYDKAAMELYGEDAVLNFPLNRFRTVKYVDPASDKCLNGHCYDDQNTYWFDGGRRCRECNRQAVARRYARKSPTTPETGS